jgi:MFS family permease
MYMNLNSLVLVVLAVPLSDHADLFGRRRLILWGYAGGLASAGLSFLFPANLAVLVLLRGLGSLLFTVSFTIQNAEVFGRLPRERRYTEWRCTAFQGCWRIPSARSSASGSPRRGSPVAVRRLVRLHRRRLAAAATHRFHESAGDEAERTSFAALLRRKELYPLSVLAFLLGGAYAVFPTFLVNLTRLRLGVPTITGFLRILLRRGDLHPTLPRLPPGGHDSPALIVGGFLLETAAFVLAFFLSTPHAHPIGFIYGIGHSVMYPLLSTLYVNSGTDADRLGLNNLYSATNMLGNIATAIVMGGAADLTGLPTVFILMAVLCAAMVPVGVSGLSAFRRRYDAPT